MHSTLTERMDGSIHDHRSKLVHQVLERRTSTMSVTTALKMLRGWRYVEPMVSNWVIAVFADLIAFTVVSSEPEIHLTLNIFSAS